MKPVTPGDPIGPALTAQWYNHTLRPFPEQKPPPKVKNTDGSVILAKNISGERIGIWEPVVITDFSTVGNSTKIVAKVERPVAGGDGLGKPFALTLQTLKINGSGKIQVAGVAIGNILWPPSVEEEYVDVFSSVLAPATAGAGKILAYDKPEGADFYRALILLNAQPVTEPIDFTLLTDLVDGEAQANIFNKAGTLIREDAEILDTQDIFDLPAGSKGIGMRMNDKFYIYNASCP